MNRISAIAAIGKNTRVLGKERFKYIAAGYLLLVEDGKLLMQRRFNTGFEDGNYSLPAGHLEGKETAREGTAREIREEIGIEIAPEDLHFAHIMHRDAGKTERFDIFFTTEKYTGVIENKEPEKCDDLSWFPLDALPENTVEYVRIAIEHWRNGVSYAEYGW